MLVYQWFLSGFAGFTSLKTVHGFGPPLPSGQGRTVRIVTFHLLAPAGVSVRVTGCSTWQRTSPGVYTGTAVATHTRTRGHRGTGIWATYSRVHLATGPLLLDHWLLALGPLAAGCLAAGCLAFRCLAISNGTDKNTNCIYISDVPCMFVRAVLFQKGRSDLTSRNVKRDQEFVKFTDISKKCL